MYMQIFGQTDLSSARTNPVKDPKKNFWWC